MPLVKRLVAGGAGSRRRAAALIIEGSVSVNGRPATNLNHPVSASDAVSVNGQPLAQAEKRIVYLLLNKPRGYLCAVSDSRGRPTVLDLVPDALRVAGLVPVGRLDADSTGLLLLSNDGAFVERVTHPRYGVVKEYDVLLDRALWPRDQARLLDGVEIEGGLARALSVSPMGNAESHRPRTAQRSASRPAPAAPRGEARYTVELAEGKKREVRLMMRAVGRRVLRLTRVRVGGLRLGRLPSGSVRELSAQEARKASHG
ncbi:MAG: rRNA pseudouridine synthase [Chloroflexi bacterium]|nr:rRNA pseudouridine synthase [Chloroflexota bacterium]MYF65107.1 rRNA pseudouridine synthase [Chloroflexota bacterium]MYK34215.1 rRNA pseudouridine synthase [Chloroflexota bacterium]